MDPTSELKTHSNSRSNISRRRHRFRRAISVGTRSSEHCSRQYTSEGRWERSLPTQNRHVIDVHTDSKRHSDGIFSFHQTCKWLIFVVVAVGLEPTTSRM